MLSATFFSFLLAIGSSSLVSRDPLRHIYLRQSDFQRGTYRIRHSGTYELAEDISFDPATLFPGSGGEYPPDEYAMGFFAALTIEAPDVTLKLNGHTLRQSKNHRLRQRFFSLIELCDRPFEPGTGPPQFKRFTSELTCGHRVSIEGPGQLGDSAHFSIHGNGNHDIRITDCNMFGFEVAAIGLNGPRNVQITGVTIGPSSQDVPANAMLTHAIFLRQHLRNILAYWPHYGKKTVALRGGPVRVSAVAARMSRAIDEFLANPDGCEGNPATRIFCNPSGVPDGSAIYGIVMHKKGPAIKDFGECSQEEARVFEAGRGDFGNILISDVNVKDIRLATEQIIALKDPEGKDQLGPTGDIFQALRAVDEAGMYRGNVVADAQVAIASLAASSGASGPFKVEVFGGPYLSPSLLQWAEGRTTLENLLSEGYKFACDMDAMAHTTKGAVGLRLEFIKGVVLRGVNVTGVASNGGIETQTKCALLSEASPHTYQGGDARGASFRFVHDAAFDRFHVSKIVSSSGFAGGWDIGAHTTLAACSGSTVGAVGRPPKEA